MNNLKPGAHIHLIGICGTAMASLAGILKELGYQVSGSDQNIYPPMSTLLESLKIPVQLGFKAENLQPRPDLVIVGNVVSKSNPEAEALLKTDIAYTSLPKAMGEFVINKRKSFVVAGTHGKTTTTSMLAFTADQMGLNPGFLIGGIPLNYGRSFKAPTRDTFIIEGDEYDTAFFDKVPKFVHYRPLHVILTSIEFDHADIYTDLEAVKAAFVKLLSLIPEHGSLIYNAHDTNILSLLPHCKALRKVGYGLNKGDYQVEDREILQGRNQLSVTYKGERVADLALKVFGQHNTLNALSVFALSHQLGWDLSKTLQSLADFKGVKRRQEVLGEVSGRIIVEDFAHHPTAVELTLKAMKERYPGARLVAVFEPRSATSRRSVFQKEFESAFSHADVVFMAQPFDQSKIPQNERFSTNQVLEGLRKRNIIAETADSVDGLLAKLVSLSQPKDVILIMSNGGFEGIYQKLFKELKA